MGMKAPGVRWNPVTSNGSGGGRVASRIARAWIPIAFIVTVLAGFTYAAAQQVYRNGADEPQIWLATQAAAAIGSGAAPDSVVGTRAIDIAVSPAPFVIVYRSDGRPTAGSGLLGGATPTPPKGVFAASTASGRDRVTWQPRAGVRIASVVMPISGERGWVLAGRSLRQAEHNVDQLGQIAFAVWAVATGGSLILIAGLEWWATR
jgi:hypothetical protein